VPTLAYYRRIFSAYILGGDSQLTFWHETPTVNLSANPAELGQYYMTFTEKANYAGVYDASGIPQLDYRGRLGVQYNPIAIAQYGLGNYNLWIQTSKPDRKQKLFRIADWLVSNLERNSHGVAVWNHHFNWEYRDTLKSPWYSSLAQGQGISLLVRAHKESNDTRYLNAARAAFLSFQHPIAEGGVAFTDESGDLWFEEYIVSPPTHILNGFMWTLWGVYDYWLATKEAAALELFSRGVQTLLHRLDRYDLGFWSLYEQSGTRLPMVASSFYHRLHIVQLRVMQCLTRQKKFAEIADRWEKYGQSSTNRRRALIYKTAFKLCHY